MYSGTTLTNASGRLLGAHQRIDRLAFNQLKYLINEDTDFPPVNSILHFEGNNGPDGIKRKSPSKDEPWHYFEPFDLTDTGLLQIISSHYNRLVMSLKINDEVRASFEAAWLAHALVDGLTPAHQFPYGQKVTELRGEGLETRSTIKDKLMLPGKTMRSMLANNWKFWGPKGLFMTHAAFEIGIATMIMPVRLNKQITDIADANSVNAKTIKDWYRKNAQDVAKMDIYSRFYKLGWRRNIAKQIKKELLPIIVRTVAISWYAAMREADPSCEL